MRGSFNRRFGPTGVRRDGRLIKAPGAVAASDYWDQLFDAVSTITPQFLWYYDASFLTTVSGDISAWADAWTTTSRDCTQATAAVRPSAGATYAEFDQSNTEHMEADFSSPVASGNHTIPAVYDLQSTANKSNIWGTKVGRLVLTANGPTKIYYYDGGNQYTDLVAATGLQYIVWNLTAGTGTANIYRNSGETSTNENYTARALGDLTALGNDYSGTNTLDGNVLLFSGYSGTDATDLAAIRTILTEITGL